MKIEKPEDDPPLVKLDSYQVLPKPGADRHVMKILLPRKELSEKLALPQTPNRMRIAERNPIKRNANSTELNATTNAPATAIETTTTSIVNAFREFGNIFIGNPFEQSTVSVASSAPATEATSPSTEAQAETTPPTAASETTQPSVASTEATVGAAVDGSSSMPETPVAPTEDKKEEEKKDERAEEKKEEAKSANSEKTEEAKPEEQKKSEDAEPIIGSTHNERTEDNASFQARRSGQSANQDSATECSQAEENAREDARDAARERYIDDEQIAQIIQETKAVSRKSPSSSGSRQSQQNSGSSNSNSASQSQGSTSNSDSSQGSSSASGSSSSSQDSSSGTGSSSGSQSQSQSPGSGSDAQSSNAGAGSNSQSSSSNSESAQAPGSSQASGSSSSSSANGQSSSSSAGAEASSSNSRSAEYNQNVGPMLMRIFNLPLIGGPLQILHRQLARRRLAAARLAPMAPLAPLASTAPIAPMAPIAPIAPAAPMAPVFAAAFASNSEADRRQVKRQAEFVVTPSPRLPITPLKEPNTIIPNGMKSFLDRYQDETSVERADRRHKHVERLMHVATVAHHLDGYLTKRLQLSVRKLHRLLNSGELN